jgi:uncharacterized protein YciI
MYDPSRKEQCFICMIRKVPNPPPIAMSAEELHVKHRAFVQSLSDRKLLLSSGPARDPSGDSHEGSIIILRVPSRADAERTLQQDPNIIHGQRKADIIPGCACGSRTTRRRRWPEVRTRPPGVPNRADGFDIAASTCVTFQVPP